MSEQPTTPVTVSLVSGRTLFRMLIADFMRHALRAEVVSEFSNMNEVLSQACHPHVNLMIFDGANPERLPEAISHVRKCSPECRVLVISNAEGNWWTSSTTKAGATGFVHEHDSLSEFYTAVLAAADYRTYHSSSARASSHIARLLDNLTPREAEVLYLTCRGLTDDAVGAALGIAATTAETHRTSIFQKLKTPSFAALLVLGIRIGLTSASEIDLTSPMRRSAGGDRKKRPLAAEQYAARNAGVTPT